MLPNQPIFRTDRNRVYVDSYMPTAGKLYLAYGETQIAPPQTNEGEVAVLDPEKNTWSVLRDDRGKVYYLEDGTRITINIIGQTLPSNAILEAPGTKYHDRYDRATSRWVFNYTKCRADLYAQIEEEKRKAQTGGVLIDGVLWDSDQLAEIRLTQIWLMLQDFPDFETEDFYANADNRVTMNLATHIGWRRANTHHLQSIFGWRSEARKEVAETANVTQLMNYFTTLKFIPTEYSKDGIPQEG